MEEKVKTGGSRAALIAAQLSRSVALRLVWSSP